MHPDLQRRARDAKAWLFNHALPLWWTRGFDAGTMCFHERLALDGTPLNTVRRSRVQARQTFVYALAGTLGWPGPWREAASAGAEVLLARVLRPDGGTASALGPEGAVSDPRRDLYDAAFAMLALAHAGAALQRADLLARAEALWGWIDATWRHPAGGFREGEVVAALPRRQNPHMHLVEALLALHEATKQTRYLDAATVLVNLCENRFIDAERGALREYFTDDLRPAPSDEGRITEPGHQFEWAWLMDRWARLAGVETPPLAQRLHAHGETHGVNGDGVAIDETWIEGGVRSANARLWPQTERLKANLVRFEKSGDAADAARAAQAYDALMLYCDAPITGLWRDTRYPDGSFKDEAAPASSFYHIALALSELIRVARI
ncbi:MAG: AGE family epimerase/isomerase [Hyphomonadaceae bacterium]|nr:AGE family epimerase/isomerase [Hyphomonadaceae bacterium]